MRWKEFKVKGQLFLVSPRLQADVGCAVKRSVLKVLAARSARRSSHVDGFVSPSDLGASEISRCYGERREAFDTSKFI